MYQYIHVGLIQTFLFNQDAVLYPEMVAGKKRIWFTATQKLVVYTT